MSKRVPSFSFPFPLIELHRHLEGSIRPEWILEIRKMITGLDIPGDLESLREISISRGKDETLTDIFLRFRSAIKSMATDNSMQYLTFKVCEEAWCEGIRLLELRFSPFFISSEIGMDTERIVRNVINGRMMAEEKLGIHVGLILIITREYGLETAKSTVDLAVKFKEDIVGIDLAGEEKGFPPNLFKREFERAKDAGLHITVHAGEVEGAKNVIDSICQLNAERIGHGIRSIEDENTLELLRTKRVPLEFCPTSNLMTHALGRIEDFPLKRLLERGVEISINTDDPAIFDTTLHKEIWLLIESLSLPISTIEETMKMALRASFLPERIKREVSPPHWDL